MKLTILLLVSIAFGALMAYAASPSVRWGMRNYFANRRERRLASQRERELAEEGWRFEEQRRKNIEAYLRDLELSINSAMVRGIGADEAREMTVCNETLGATYTETWKDGKVRLTLIEIQ